MTPQARRRFDHLATELSLALGTPVPRHALWLEVADHLDSSAGAVAFCGDPLDGFLARVHLAPPSARDRRRLSRSVAHFDPAHRTPEEIFGALFGSEPG